MILLIGKKTLPCYLTVLKWSVSMKISMLTNGVIERRRSIERTHCSWVLRRYRFLTVTVRQLNKASVYLLNKYKNELADGGWRTRANFDEGP